jgi:DNA-binding MarR family transcriptional regulator
MHYLHKYLEFTTIDEGKKKLEEARNLRNQMGGALFYGIVSEDCREIEDKLNALILSENQPKS